MVIFGITAIAFAIIFLAYGIYDYFCNWEESYIIAFGMSAFLAVVGVVTFICNGVVNNCAESFTNSVAKLEDFRTEVVCDALDSGDSNESVQYSIQYSDCNFYENCTFVTEEKEEAAKVDEKEFDLIINKDGIEFHRKKKSAE